MTHCARDLRRNMTDAEHRLWQHLRRDQMGVRFRRQYVFHNRVILDFFAPRIGLAIEVDGGQHADQAAADAKRTQWLNEKGVQVLRYWNRNVLLATRDVLDDIFRHVTEIGAKTSRLDANTSPPAPLLGGGGRRARMRRSAI